jgi:signal peptide peptidase-like 3
VAWHLNLLSLLRARLTLPPFAAAVGVMATLTMAMALTVAAGSSVRESVSAVVKSFAKDPTVLVTVGVAVLTAHLAVVRACSCDSYVPLSLSSLASDSPRSSPRPIDDASPMVTTMTQAALLPVAAAVAIVALYLFSSIIGPLLIAASAISGGMALAFALWPAARQAPLLLPVISTAVVVAWLYTGHWVLNNVLTACACILVVSLLRLPDLRTTTVLLVGLVVYDVFFVFFAAKLFSSMSSSPSSSSDAKSVMVAVATATPRNPLAILVSVLGLDRVLHPVADLALPAKFVVPALRAGAHADEFCILGAGDIIMPSLALVYLRGVDLQWKDCKRPQGRASAYYHVGLVMFLLSLLTTFMVNGIFLSAQPALLYIVPFVLGGVIGGASARGELGAMWRGERVVHEQEDERYEENAGQNLLDHDPV